MTTTGPRRSQRWAATIIGAGLAAILFLGVHGGASYYSLTKTKILLNDNLRYIEEVTNVPLGMSDFAQMSTGLDNFAASIGILGVIMIPLGVILGFSFVFLLPALHQLIASSNMRIRTNRVGRFFFGHRYRFLITMIGLLFSIFLLFVGSATSIEHEREKEIRDTIKVISISDKAALLTQLDNFLSGKSTLAYHSSVYSQAYFIGIIILMSVGIWGYNHRMRIIADSAPNHNPTDILLAYICVFCFVASLIAIGYWIGASAFGAT